PLIGFAGSGHGAAPALQRHPKRIGPGSAMRRFRTMLRIALAAHCVRGTIVETLALAVIAPARRRRAVRRPRYQQRECKADAAGDQQRAERVVLHLLGNHLRTVAESLAAVIVGILGVASRRLASVAYGILGLAVQILHGTGGFAYLAGRLCLRIAGQISNSAFRASGEFLGRSDNPIIIHDAPPRGSAQVT